MKMIFAVVNSNDSNSVMKALTKNGFSATKLATTGGFLMSGNTTFLIGVDDEKVEPAIEIISSHSKKRKQIVTSNMGFDVDIYNTVPIEVTVGGATIFVIDVERFEKV